MNNILHFIGQEKPDILALQEVYNGHDPSWPCQYRTMEVLSKAFPYLQYSHFAAAFLDQTDVGAVEQGNAIFSRFPIVNSQITFADVPYCTRMDRSNIPHTPRNLQQVTLDLSGSTIHVLNIQGIWGRDGVDNERRLLMANMIVGAIKEKERSILCGDFNVQMNTKTIQKIEAHLTNVYKGKLTSSFNLRHKKDPAFATAVVDTIFLGSHFTLLKAATSDRDVSDHLPLIAVVLCNPHS